MRGGTYAATADGVIATCAIQASYPKRAVAQSSYTHTHTFPVSAANMMMELLGGEAWNSPPVHCGVRPVPIEVIQALLGAHPGLTYRTETRCCAIQLYAYTQMIAGH